MPSEVVGLPSPSGILDVEAAQLLVGLEGGGDGAADRDVVVCQGALVGRALHSQDGGHGRVLGRSRTGRDRGHGLPRSSAAVGCAVAARCGTSPREVLIDPSLAGELQGLPDSRVAGLRYADVGAVQAGGGTARGAKHALVAQQLHDLAIGVDQGQAVRPAVLEVGSRQPNQDRAEAAALIRDEARQLLGEVVAAVAAVVEDQAPAQEIGLGRACDLDGFVLVEPAVVVVELVDEDGRGVASEGRGSAGRQQ